METTRINCTGNLRNCPLATRRIEALAPIGARQNPARDLCQPLYERPEKETEYRFHERITALEDRGDSVAVELKRGPAEVFDLVIGADGSHSGVRALAFGDEFEFELEFELCSFSPREGWGGQRSMPAA